MLKVLRVSTEACNVCRVHRRRLQFAVAAFSEKKDRQKDQWFLKKPKEKKEKRVVNVWRGITIAELGRALGKDSNYVFDCLYYTPHADDFEKASQPIESPVVLASLAKVADVQLSYVTKPSIQGLATNVFDDMKKDLFRKPPPDPKLCVPRPPVVTIMGHVDHGKTTLLDFLRKSQIVQGEFGGITQHIGAFFVTLPDSKAKITFLDTPGHAAFKNMRARGARVTDIVILVVAADDGVMEQTLESIRFAREANVPMIVAVNKCDKPNKDIERVKQQLLTQNIALEDYGGDVQCINISALKGTGIKELQEAILTQAEVMNLRGDPNCSVEGAIIESKTSAGKGKVATVLVHRGTLKKGTILVAGTTWCRVKAMYDEFGALVVEAPPSTPVEVTGWKDELPSAGDEVLEAQNEEDIEKHQQDERETYLKKRQSRYEMTRAAMDSIHHKKKKVVYKDDEQRPKSVERSHDEPELAIIIKGDVDGSVEALLDVCDTYSSKKCKFDIINFGVGPVTESDIELASTFDAIVYAFNVKVADNVAKQAQEKNVTVKSYNIIYRLVDDLKEELSRRLPILDIEEVIGEGLVLKQFLVSHGPLKVPVAGCRCVKGTLVKKYRVKFMRGDQIVYDGEIDSLKIEKNDVNSAQLNDEVGMLVTDPSREIKFETDDRVICYKLVPQKQQVDWFPPGF